MRVTHEIEITPTSVRLDGQELAVTERGEKLLSELYRSRISDYPRFYKMDTLSRLGFVASELLLQAEKATGDELPTNRAVIFANRSASIKNDTDFIQTIAPSNYYPAPALFVYTLPNIVTAEIAIRNHYTAETAFYILAEAEQLLPIVKTTLQQPSAPQSALVGWCECSAADTYYAKIQIIWNN